MAAQFRKNNQGAWVVMGPASEVRVGWVTVSKRDGRTSKVQIASVGQHFTANGVAMVYGYIAERGAAKPVAPKSEPRSDAVDEEVAYERDLEVAAERAAERRIEMGLNDMSGGCDVF